MSVAMEARFLRQAAIPARAWRLARAATKTMPQTMQWIAGTDALAMSVAMEARFQGRTCILCGCGESGNARPFVQDKSEYPEGIPDDLMALPLCRMCLRVKSQGEPFCVCCPFTDPSTSMGPETLKIALREKAAFHSMGAYNTGHGDGSREAMVQAARLAIGNEAGAAHELEKAAVARAAAGRPDAAPQQLSMA